MPMRVIVEVELPAARTVGVLGDRQRRSRAQAIAEEAGSAASFQLDDGFGARPVRIRRFESGRDRIRRVGVDVLSGRFREVLRDRRETWILRGEAEEPEKIGYHFRQHPNVVAVFADPRVYALPGPCIGDGPLGTIEDVRELLSVDQLTNEGLDGTGVEVAVVDAGLSLDQLRQVGRDPAFRAEPGWSSGDRLPGGPCAENHGSMCAWLSGVAAPQASLLDFGFLHDAHGELSALLSDAIVCFGDLLDHVEATGTPLVVTNSWGLLDTSLDAAPGTPERYCDNPDHLFNLAVADLDAAGADVVFAAGNCGPAGPDNRCNFGGGPTIAGANSHPAALTVGGVDVQKRVASYSSAGPGCLTDQKPDVTAFTHFQGFCEPGPDFGTSAAAPLVAGVVAAIRTQISAEQASPALVRELIRQTAAPLDGTAFNYESGWGILQPTELLGALRRVTG